MKQILFLLGGLCAAAAGFLVLRAGSVSNFKPMNRRLETVWIDQHTAA